MDFRINGTGRGYASGALGASDTRARLSGSQAIDESQTTSSANSEAAVVSLASESLTNSSSSTADALRTLSDAESYISIAANAAASIEDLIGQLGDVYNSLQTTNDPDGSQLLYDEADTILGEIGTIIEASQLNGSSVVEAGSQTFSFSIDSEALATGTSSGSLSVLIDNVALGFASLGLPNPLTSRLSDGFLNEDFEATDGSGLALLQAAQLQVDAVQSSLASSADQLNTVAQAFGVSTDIEAEAIENGTLDNSSAESLTSKIVSDISSALTAQTGGLNPLRIEELLAPVEPPKRKEKDRDTEESSLLDKLSSKQDSTNSLTAEEE